MRGCRLVDFEKSSVDDLPSQSQHISLFALGNASTDAVDLHIDDQGVIPGVVQDTIPCAAVRWNRLSISLESGSYG